MQQSMFNGRISNFYCVLDTQAGGREAQANMEETDRERLP